MVLFLCHCLWENLLPDEFVTGTVNVRGHCSPRLSVEVWTIDHDRRAVLPALQMVVIHNSDLPTIVRKGPAFDLVKRRLN